MESDARAEGERLLTIAAKFLQTKDLTSAHDFAALAQETAPLLDGSDQIIAISDVLLAAETKKVNNKLNWYAILGLDSKLESIEAIKKQYRKLALLLHPDKNNYAFAHDAFRLVADAWAVLSDVSKKRGFDSEYGIFSKVNLGKKVPHQQNYSKGGVSGGGVSGAGTPRRLSSFWTTCPYCYNLYEYPRVYKDCVLKCGNCNRAMHGTEIKTLPPVVEGQEAYYCCWGFFPMGFTGNEDGGSGNGRKEERGPNWVPPVNVENLNEGNGGEEDGNVTPVYRNVSVGGNVTPPHRNVSVTGNVTPVHRNVGVGSGSSTGAKKRGRPRKNL
ncbi:uncharacterized protein LOC141711244 [Apium graveolens]|uniref:uncharacterized protein LOC141711244 n=1 Tax=Apium graveolens TaxID=4045 RepID=UPI003D78B5BD